MGGAWCAQSSARSSTSSALVPTATSRSRGRRSRLVLHFDINNTLLAADPGAGLGLHQAVNLYVAGIVWVRQAADGTLEWAATTREGKASLNCPETGFVTYYKFLEVQAEAEGRSRKDFKSELARFSDTPQGAPARVWVDRILGALTAPELGEPFAFEENGKRYHYILPAFWRLLSWLHEDGREFSVVLRTFGSDGPRIAQTIKAFAAGRHPEYPHGCPRSDLADVPPLRLSRWEEGIRLDWASTPEAAAAEGVEHVAADECGVFEFLNDIRGTLVVQDDYKYWSRHGYVASAGKPLWVPFVPAEQGSNQPQHILFDDNVRTEEYDNSIADVRKLVPWMQPQQTVPVVNGNADAAHSSGGAASGRQLWRAEGSFSPAEAEAAGFLVQAALHESALEQDYFRAKVELCEQRWALWMAQRRASGGRWSGCCVRSCLLRSENSA